MKRETGYWSWNKCLGSGSGFRRKPNNAAAVGGDPLLLLLKQGLLAIDAEQTIERALLTIKPIELQGQNRLDLAVAIEPLLMGQSQLGQGDKSQDEADRFQAKAKESKQQLFTGNSRRGGQHNFRLRSRGRWPMRPLPSSETRCGAASPGHHSFHDTRL